jgi:hypothetical protein
MMNREKTGLRSKKAQINLPDCELNADLIIFRDDPQYDLHNRPMELRIGTLGSETVFFLMEEDARVLAEWILKTVSVRYPSR